MTGVERANTKDINMRRNYLVRWGVIVIVLVLVLLPFTQFFVPFRILSNDKLDAIKPNAFDFGIPVTEIASRKPLIEIKIWIDVKNYAEGIGGWRSTLMQLLHLAWHANITIVEPCMNGGRLNSCVNRGVPVSKIFDLDDALHPYNRSLAVLVPYDEYTTYRMTTVANVKEYNVCMSRMSKKNTPIPKERCPNSTMLPKDIDAPAIRNLDSNSFIILNLEDHWINDSKLARMLGVQNENSEASELRFHPSHDQTVTRILDKAHIKDGNFSVVHWRAEKSGIDFIQCANAVLQAKTRIEQDEGRHPFILLTSLNKNASMMWGGSRIIADRNRSALVQALDMLSDHNIAKFDELMAGQLQYTDAGMLAVYDLILASKSRNFATCARDEKHGCFTGDAAKVCERCNHIGKFGKLAISLRKMSMVHADESSWGCWPKLMKTADAVEG